MCFVSKHVNRAVLIYIIVVWYQLSFSKKVMPKVACKSAKVLFKKFLLNEVAFGQPISENNNQISVLPLPLNEASFRKQNLLKLPKGPFK
jgi:hypothetical protein